jgi:hypothetical protein
MIAIDQLINGTNDPTDSSSLGVKRQFVGLPCDASAPFGDRDRREIPIVDGMLALDGRYFGEWRIRTHHRRHRSAPIRPSIEGIQKWHPAKPVASPVEASCFALGARATDVEQHTREQSVSKTDLAGSKPNWRSGHRNRHAEIRGRLGNIRGDWSQIRSRWLPAPMSPAKSEVVVPRSYVTHMKCEVTQSESDVSDGISAMSHCESEVPHTKSEVGR